MQVVEARHSKVHDAERRILAACAGYSVHSHPFEAYFGTTEALRMRASPVIGDLRDWLGQGRDRTPDWLARVTG